MQERVISVINSKTKAGTLFVLKGFQTINYGVEKVDIQSTIQNKIARLLQLTQQKQQIISFDEFICLYDLVLLQYKEIYVIENPVYMNLFPVDVKINDVISNALLNHFDSDADDNAEIGDINEYTLIYSNYLLTDQGIACCYNISDDQLKNEKIERLVVGNPASVLLDISTLDDEKEYINLCNDVDYYQLVRELYSTAKIFAVTWESYLAGKEIAKKRLELLCGQFPQRVFAYLIPAISNATPSNQEIAAIMEKYWGYTNYREIKTYDLNEVEKKHKKVVAISQEKIINDLVEQVERCVAGKSFKDVFVTAPTGAGKSLMFQLPAIYLAEKYNLVTLVITPLIGLMNDQVQALSKRGYTGARTINSDISPIIKQDILEEVASGKCHILYLSPESLLSRSDIEQLIGTQRIGMLVVDEAHIVTTWGKQFRPDYWYLGDHVQKLRRAQARKEVDPSPFIVATFTATAIYEGKEDMYHETLNSLHMIDPITYLGYVKRDNISIEISEVEVKRNKTEYEINKFDSLISMIKMALMRNQKTLIYFPTVALINRFYDYCYSKNLSNYVAKYHGQMDAATKDESFQDFLSSKKMIMLATKAFGMGIDIPDIAIVSHFAPTGNVCDYMQEVGRAARDSSIQGHAIYQHMSNDFKHINRLHGLSAIQKYQLVEVIKKILEIYTKTRYENSGRRLTKKRNEMLVDTESFAYIFEGPQSDENELINKVKTAMLLIQKDYENRGFAPFYMRPIPLFAYGYFSISPKIQEQLNKKYHNAAKLIFYPQNVCEVNLKKIWDHSYSQTMSFPKFKFLLYTGSPELDFNQKYTLTSAMSVEVFLDESSEQYFASISNAIKEVTHVSVYQGKYFSLDEIIDFVSQSAKLSRYRAESIVGVVISAMDVYRRNYSGRMNNYMYQSRVSRNGDVSYQFSTASREFFTWLDKGFRYVKENTKENQMYVVNEKSSDRCKEITTILGVLESFGTLRFKSLGGSNSQIYIYVNETKNMQIVRDKPNSYRNKLLELINNRHRESVRMLTFLFQSKLTSNDVWEHLENYFLGILPETLLHDVKETETAENVEDVSVLFQIGDDLKSDYPNWESANVLFDSTAVSQFDDYNIPLADYYAAKLIIGNTEADVELAWTEQKVALTTGEESDEFREIAKLSGWTCIPMDSVNVSDLAPCF